MKIYLLLLLFIASSTLQAITSDPYKNINYFELDNGLKVYILSDAKAVNTQVELDVKVGMSIENEKNAGISHLLEHLIFRDQRIAHKDYVDYLKDEGATFVNGYTSQNETSYVATIDANKSFFLVKEFATMLFDKNVTKEDLEIEKRALQNEIGELKWYHPILYPLSVLFRNLHFPDKPDIFKDSFGLEEDTLPPLNYFYIKNNKDFTLETLLKHYETYYYPKNMTLKIAGNFDAKEMEKLVKEQFGSIQKKGEKSTKDLGYDAALSKEPYRYFSTGESGKSVAYIGGRYILDDYKKYLILEAYSEHLATKMQQLLRNKLGKTYSVLSYNSTQKNAALSGVILESLHKDFASNLKIIQDKIASDVKKIPSKEIQEALHQAELFYASKEHDSKSLMESIETAVYLHEYQHIYDKDAYELFEDIEEQEFQKVVSDTFKNENSYLYIYKDYYLFPFDMLILSLLMIWTLIYIIKKVSSIKVLNGGLSYTHRDVLVTRRLTNVFISFIIVTFMVFVSIFVSEWSSYYIYLALFNNPHFLYTLEEPYSLFVNVIDFIFFIFIYILLSLTLFKNYYVKIDVTQDSLYIVGNRVISIDKDAIIKIEKVSWSMDKFLHICGVSILFFKPLVMIQHKNGVCYLRSKNASELEEDLNKWFHKES